MEKKNRYAALIEAIFRARYTAGRKEVAFVREDIEEFSHKLGIEVPKNIGDLIYSFRYRTPLPESVQAVAPKGKQWVILPDGRSRYKFVAQTIAEFTPNPMLSQIKIPDATPGVISLYALSDEQALLARLRYNRLVDIFTCVTSYSLQNHLRTTAPGLGQVETDETYVGIDRRGVHFVFPVQAKGGTDRLSVVQIHQDFVMCKYKFPTLICRPLGAQFISDDVIALFEFSEDDEGIRIASEKHYKLVPPELIEERDLRQYQCLGVDD